MNKLILLSICIPFFFLSCAKSNHGEVEIYSNDFESSASTGITNATISSFNGGHVLGFFNNSQFTLSVSDLPEHDIVDISFDLYIHDNWDGNIQLQDNIAGPDIWQMKVDNKTYITTTFSNNDCTPGYFCPPQSYPSEYPNFNHNPKSGASQTVLPGVCSKAGSPNGSTLYKIQKSISHSEKVLLFQCLDKLIQKDVADPKCDESWSVDNIKIKVINLK